MVPREAMEEIKKELNKVAERFGCSLIYLFGSQAEIGRRYFEGEKVQPDPFADLDVVMAFTNPPENSFEVYGKLFREISEVFEPFRVDLVFMHEVHTLFQYEIIKGVRIFAQDEFIADEIEEDIMKRAEDLSYKKRIFDQEVMEALECGYFEFEYTPNA